MQNRNDGSASAKQLRVFFERKVADHMTTRAITIAPGQTLGDLGSLIEHYDFNSFPVVAHERLLGVVTKFDFLRMFALTTAQLLPSYVELMGTTIDKVMTGELITVDPAMPLTRVLQLMVEKRSRSFPVVGPNKALLGMISREDVIRALRESVQVV